MNHKSLILAVLLLPSLCAAQTKEEKTLNLLKEMTSLMLKLMVNNHQMMLGTWQMSIEDRDFVNKVENEAQEMYKQAEKLSQQIEELSHE